MRTALRSRTIVGVEQEPLIHREELTATLFAISDLNKNVRKILRILEEEDNGEEPEDDP